jgi:hypothetical protein
VQFLSVCWCCVLLPTQGLESLHTPVRHTVELWQRMEVACKEAIRRLSEMHTYRTGPETLHECIEMAETALQQHWHSAQTRSHVLVSGGQGAKFVLSSGAIEPFLSTGVAEPSSSSGATEPLSSSRAEVCSLSTGAAVTQKRSAVRMLFCTASFASDNEVQISLPLNILFTAHRSDVEFYHVTFGQDIALQNWMQHNLQWVRALCWLTFTCGGECWFCLQTG